MATSPFDINFSPTASPVDAERKTYNDLNSGFTNFLGSQATVPQLTTKYNDQFGIPQLQSNIAKGQEQYDALGNQLAGLPKDVAQRSQESILTQGQKNRVVQAEQAPILQQQSMLGQNINQMGNRLSTAQTNAGNMISAEQAQQTKMTQPWLQAYSNENVLSSMAMTGWTQSNSQELQRLLANQQAGITLSEGEKNRANQLAMQEKDFENSLKVAKAKDTTGSNYITAGAGTSIFDPSTGKFIGTAPYKPESGSGNYTPNFGTNTQTTPQPTKGFVPLTYGKL